MTASEKDDLIRIATHEPWFAGSRLKEYLKTVQIVETTVSPKTRTSSQHRALFLWFGQIEQICANQGVTADMVFRHTTQIAITRESLHHMCKTLIKALFNIDSTKDIEKTGHLDKIIDHFTALFAQEGVELPPFPSDEQKAWEELGHQHIETNVEYPDDYQKPTF